MAVERMGREEIAEVEVCLGREPQIPERRQGERRKGERRGKEIRYDLLLSGIACRRSGLDRRKADRRKKNQS